MSVPEGRCGFVFDDRPTPSHPNDREYVRAPAVCCWRPSWDGSNSGRCFWHAEVTGKQGSDRPDPSPGHPERLDGAFLRDALFLSADLSDVILRGADLSGAHFPGANLARADLSGGDLSKTNLSGATLWDVDLGGTDLSGAILSGADLSGAILSDADLSGAILPDADLPNLDLSRTGLAGADLSRADLSGTVLRDANLSEATLRGANLSGAELGGANLSGAELGGANLSDAELVYTDLSKARLEGADLSSAMLSETDLSGADLSDATLSGVDISSADLAGATLRGVDLTLVDRHESIVWRSTLAKADLTGADLSGADLRSADLSRWDLSGVDLSGANLQYADLSRADLSGADLSGVDLGMADLQGTNLTAMTFTDDDPPTLDPLLSVEGAIFDSVDFSGLDLRNHDFRGTSFRYADLSGADLYGGWFDRGDLTGAILDEADCRRAEFPYADLEGASFIECDLRSAELDGTNLYHATMTDCKMNLETTVAEAFAYPPFEAEERALHPVRSAARSGVDRTGKFLGLREEADDAGRPEAADARSPWRGHTDLSRWLERRAWTHQTIHRQLIRHGRIEQAIREKHYLEEQRARLRRARLERLRAARRLVDDTPSARLGSRHTVRGSSHLPDGKTARYDRALWLGRSYGSDLSAVLRTSLAVLNARTSYRLIRMSESPLYVARVILVVAALFAFVVYPSVGGFDPVSTQRLVSRTAPGFPVSLGSRSVLLPWVVLDAWRLFVFSFLTFFEGTYLVLSETIGAFLPVDDLVPSGVSVVTLSRIRPTGAAVWAAWVERLLGALLVVPFALLVVQRLRLYVGAATSEGGFGGGLLSWLLGR